MIPLICRKQTTKWIGLGSVLIWMAAFLLLPSLALAADRLYFVSLVENDRQGDPRILLEWGSLEGSVPPEITHFRLYRSKDSGAFDLIRETLFAVADPAAIQGIVLSDFNEGRKQELMNLLQEMSDSLSPPGPRITTENFAGFLRSVIDPSSSGFNPLQRMLLIRFHPGVAQAAGLAFADDRIDPSSSYEYLLTAVTASGESLPVGKSGTIDPRVPTVLPAPAGLTQVRVSGCSLIHKNLDDLRIHLNWDVPSRPQDISLNILTYGYDLFWSDTDLGPLDFRSGVPAGLYRVNSKPIVVSGEKPEEGKDGFLARDSGETHLQGPAWQRGQKYYYYLAARDLAGNYSSSLAPLEATVVDAKPPVSAWRLHTEELSEVSGGSDVTPRLALVWDQINPVNYIRYYGTGRSVCRTAFQEVCMADSHEACSDEAAIRCADLEVVNYHVFRFSSPADAAAWGTDTDADFWPDAVERDRGTDPCDGSDFPGMVPPDQLAATIGQSDPAFQRWIADRHVQMVFVDTAVNSSVYDKVFYYKVLAEDSSGNFSPLSPPVRGALYDRTQPAVSAGLQVLDCDNYTAEHRDTQAYREGEDVLTLVDKTGRAAKFILTRLCQGGSHVIPSEQVMTGSMKNGFAHIGSGDIPPDECDGPGCSGGMTLGYSVGFFDDTGLPMAASDPFPVSDLCTPYHGAVILDALCLWTDTRPGQVVKGPVRICAGLLEGQTARVYYETGGQMSPAETIEYDPDPENGEKSCIEITDMAGLVTADLCLGIRVFSENHVGSGMTYFNCLEMVNSGGAAPPPPLIQGIYSKETETQEPCFELVWSAPREGQAAFVISMKSDTGTRNETVFPEQRNESGQFSRTLRLDPETDLDREWCFTMRTIATSMQTSDWSRPVCATWTLAELENLAWPMVNEPVDTGTVQAFFIKEGSAWGRPALMLSTDMTANLSLIGCTYSPTGACLGEVPVCDGTALCIQRGVDDAIPYDQPVNFSSVQAGNFVDALVGTRNFIVYRQEQGRDFVQVSPLVNGFSFVHRRVRIENQSHVEYRNYYQLQDPFYFLRKLEPGAIGGVDPVTVQALDPAAHSGTRMVFLDRYPHAAGSTIRYQLVFLDPETHEPKTTKTSNWLTLP